MPAVPAGADFPLFLLLFYAFPKHYMPNEDNIPLFLSTTMM